MSTGEVLVWVGAIASVIAAGTGVVVIWLNRTREPLTLEPVNTTTMRLTRTRWPDVYIHEVFVLCHGPLISVDRAATLRGRLLQSHRQILIDVAAIPIGESVVVRYSRSWRPGRLTRKGMINLGAKEKSAHLWSAQRV